MTGKRSQMIEAIWWGRDPLAGAADPTRVDQQGWQSDNPYLTQAIDQVMPAVVVEVGVWKGASVITMGRRMRELGLDGVIIAVDTWLGAWDHWMQAQWFDHLRFEGGYPTLFKTFASNIAHERLNDYVLPLPLDSVNAATVLKSKGVVVDVVHIDGGHDFDAVTSDLNQWWPLLRQGGILIGDDYHPNGDMWPEVRRAFNAFFNAETIENSGGKCLIHKA